LGLPASSDPTLRLSVRAAQVHGLRELGQFLIEGDPPSIADGKRCLEQCVALCSETVASSKIAAATLIGDHINALSLLARMAANAGEADERDRLDRDLVVLKSARTNHNIVRYKGSLTESGSGSNAGMSSSPAPAYLPVHIRGRFAFQIANPVDTTSAAL